MFNPEGLRQLRFKRIKRTLSAARSSSDARTSRGNEAEGSGTSSAGRSLQLPVRWRTSPGGLDLCVHCCHPAFSRGRSQAVISRTSDGLSLCILGKSPPWLDSIRARLQRSGWLRGIPGGDGPRPRRIPVGMQSGACFLPVRNRSQTLPSPTLRKPGRRGLSCFQQYFWL